MNTNHTSKAQAVRRPDPHTPGPWQVEVYHKDKAWAEVHTTRRGQDIPTQGYLVAIVFDTPDCPNARLIAKAPDMLHWLRETEHYLSSRRSMGHELTDGELWLRQHIRLTIKEAA